MNSVWTCWIVFCLALPCFAEGPSRQARITKVLHDTQPQKRESALARDVTPNDVGKFKELREDFAPKLDGEYFAVIWKSLSREPLKNVTVTLHYRQANLPGVQSAQVEFPEVPRGTSRAEFRVVGESFTKGGTVTAWRAEVSADGKTLDSFRSFLWKDPS